MREISFIRNGSNPIWVAFDPNTGKTCGQISPPTPELRHMFQVWIDGIHGKLIPQGSPHATLDAAKADLIDLLS